MSLKCILKVEPTQKSTHSLYVKGKKRDKKDSAQVSSLISCMMPFIKMG